MTENHRGRHRQSYNKINHSNKSRYRKNGNKNNSNSQQRDHTIQYEDIEDERPSFSHLKHDLNNVDASMNLERWRSSSTVQRYFGLGYSSTSTVDKQFNTLSITEQQEQKQQQKRPLTTELNDDNDIGFYFDSTPSKINHHYDLNNDKNENNPLIKLNENDDFNDDYKNKNPKRKSRRDNKKKQKGRKIIPGSDIHISLSSDEEDQVHKLDRNNKSLTDFHLLDNDEDDEDDEDGVDEIVNDYLENTDPETWQQFNQWTKNRPVDDQQYGQIHDYDDDDDDILHHHGINYNMNDDDSDSDEDILDFGLSDSEVEDENQNLHAGMHNYYPPTYYSSMQHHLVPQPSNSKRKNSSKSNNYNNKYDTAYQLERIDRRLQVFIMDDSRNTYQLPGMSDYCRRLVQGLATIYRLKLTPELASDGKIYPLLRKSPKTCIPKDRKAIDKHINKKRTIEKAKKKMKKKPKENQSKVSAKPAGKIVGQHAAPIASNNIGHKMMSAMGWKEGQSLGNRNDGILNPIEVKILSKRRGLGS
ncbi:unnamed protein product [Cunninghamella blakesleeana]